jgi:sigma-B regulation protein RsbU (phosphoserine phosphatase)
MFFSQAISIQMTSLFDIRGVISNVFKFAAFILYFNLFYINNIRRPYVLLSNAKEELNAYTFELDRLVDKRTSEFRQANERMLAILRLHGAFKNPCVLPAFLRMNLLLSLRAMILQPT